MAPPVTESAERMNPAPSPASVEGTVNILLVDDEIRNLDVLESVLQSPDYHLVRALTAERALMLLLDGDFAAIVLDIQMPEMSGIELANLIKQRRKTQNIPILFLTAYFQEDKDVLEGYSRGAVDYLTKPINPQILRSKISVFADLYRKTRALELTNRALELEVVQRQRAEEALRRANNDLEARVEARTADLSRVNEELLERERALKASETRALAASRAKDDFLARLSHELRTPLNPVLLLASDAAGNPDLPADVRAHFDMIATNISLEARLIDDLLDLTRIARGKLSLDLRPTDVHVVVKEALEMVRGDVEQKRLTVELKLDADQHKIHGDDVRLQQIFWNVLKNAVKFTPKDGRITVETASPASSSTIEVRITDTGIGMTPAEIARVFDAFTQGDHAGPSGQSHKFGGLGLGLAISRMLVELHTGTISVSSAGRDAGTTFLVELPLISATGRSGNSAAPTPANGSDAGAARPHGTLKPRRILLVEDHAPTSNTLTRLLTRRQYEVVSASCLADARAAASRENFDLLISDIGLPDGNGYELMSELRGRHKLIGIALTGYGMEEDVGRSQAAGFVAHLTKPISVQALENALTTATRAAGETTPN